MLVSVFVFCRPHVACIYVPYVIHNPIWLPFLVLHFTHRAVCLSCVRDLFFLLSSLSLSSYQIRCLRRSFTKNKHILKLLIIAIRRRERITILPINHCVMQTESDFLEVKSLPKRRSGFTPFHSRITDYPNNYPAFFGHSIQ